MKRLAIFFTMTIITLSLNAQTEPTYTETFDNIFVNVSRTQATTGIFYERVVLFANLVNFNSNRRLL